MHCDFETCLVANPEHNPLFEVWLQEKTIKKKTCEIEVEVGKSDVSCFSDFLDYAKVPGYNSYTTSWTDDGCVQQKTKKNMFR